MNATKFAVPRRAQTLEARTALAMRMTRSRTRPVGGDDGTVIVSMTSHPARIRNAWMALESLLRQDLRPIRIVLTLSEEEFPSRRLPKVYRRLMKRGVEVLWTPKNIRSFKKLLPVAAENPSSTIVTVDDDKLFAPDRIAAVVTASGAHPEAIVGAQGWEMRTVSGRLEWSNGWERADLNTPSDAIFLTSGTATLYPPGSLSDVLHDYELANRLVPTNDDMWFWAMARLAGTKQICLGLERLTRIVRQDATPSLAAINERNSGSQFAALREFLSLDGDLLPDLREARAN
jgi:hypothetical protein